MEKSSTTKTQKIVIWFIIIFMAVGSIGAYFAIIVANNNSNDPELQKQDQERELAKQQAEYEKQIKEQQEEEAKVKKEPLDGYEATAFDKAGVTELKVETLKQGDGKVATKESTVEANYFGWTSDGKIFDSSKRDGQTSPATFPLSGVIKGWTEGLTGVKQGSVVKLTIPADKAYGTAGSPPTIGANEPLVFIVELKAVK
jgi:FKBP-type peptidyl-prolyl cis-trans isomerase